MILHGDCLIRLKDLADNSVDACVTDSPYGIKFMGRVWDYDVPSVEMWKEVLRVLKPGAHLLSFGGTRTYHRMAVNIEDAGFEIRDQIMWLYGSGFPKSHSIDKAIDKMAGATREVVGSYKATGTARSKGNIGAKTSAALGGYVPDVERIYQTAPATPDAIKWQGWGTALKPANEPIVLARKPLDTSCTIAENVLKWGVGGLNIDASRIESTYTANELSRNFTKNRPCAVKSGWAFDGSKGTEPNPQGRFPANVILSCDCEGEEHGQLCAVHLLDEQSGVSKSTANVRRNNPSESIGTFETKYRETNGHADTGGASRYFKIIKEDVCGLENVKADVMSVGKKTANSDVNLNTDTCGNSTSDQYPMGTISITRTATHLTMTCQILSASRHTHIGTCTIESEKIICPLVESNIESVSVVSSTEVLIHSLGGAVVPIKGTVRIAFDNISEIGESETANITTPITENIGQKPLRFLYQAKASKRERNHGCEGMEGQQVSHMITGSGKPSESVKERAAEGEPNRFTATHQNFHPTVKPIKLMEYLIKLITPNGGLVLDPFAGSGSTGVACRKLGYEFIGIEMNEEYVEIAERRIEAHEPPIGTEPAYTQKELDDDYYERFRDEDK